MKMWVNGKPSPVIGKALELSDFTADVCPGSLMLGNDNGNHFITGQV
jgi:hypothetical protein